MIDPQLYIKELSVMDPEINLEICVPHDEQERANLKALSEYLNNMYFGN